MIDQLKDWLTAPEAARVRAVARPRIHQLVKANVLDGTRIAGRLLVQRRSVDEWARVRRPPGRPPVPKPSTLESLRKARARILDLGKARDLDNVRVLGSGARGRETELMFVLWQELGRRVDVTVLSQRSPIADQILAEAVPL